MIFECACHCILFLYLFVCFNWVTLIVVAYISLINYIFAYVHTEDKRLNEKSFSKFYD